MMPPKASISDRSAGITGVLENGGLQAQQGGKASDAASVQPVSNQPDVVIRHCHTIVILTCYLDSSTTIVQQGLQHASQSQFHSNYGNPRLPCLGHFGTDCVTALTLGGASIIFQIIGQICGRLKASIAAQSLI